MTGVDTRRARTRALLIHPNLHPAGGDGRTSEGRLQEAVGLAQALDLELVHQEIVRVSRQRPATLFGRGMVERTHDLVAAFEIELAIVDSALSPVQQRSLEESWECKVIDRTALILEIFGARARTHEGRLQVTLAALTFQRSRLVRSWTHLERQRGGAGFLGGPGERQLELDRRQLDEQIARVKRDLAAVVRTRGLHRSARRHGPTPVIALVGYTNAGKSTLFNRLTGSDVNARDMLFATLDPTMRRIALPSGRDAVVSDTVGFVSDLPTHLIAAFRATLEEVQEADLILHVRDISHPEHEQQKVDVERILDELGVDTEGSGPDFIEVFNKIDLLSREDRQMQLACPTGRRIAVSAQTGEGCDALAARIDRVLGRGDLRLRYRLDPGNGAAIAWLHRYGRVVEQDWTGDGILVSVMLTPADAGRFREYFPGSVLA